MSLFTPTFTSFSSYGDETKFLLVWRLSLTFTFIFVGLCVLFLFDNVDASYAYLTALGISVSAIVYLRRTTDFRTIFFGYAILGTIIINLSANLILDAPHYADFLWVLLGVLLTYFGLGMRWGFAFLVVNILCMVYFVFFTLDEHLLQLHALNLEGKVILSIELMACTSLITYVIYQFVKVNRNVELELIKKNKWLEQSNVAIQKNSEVNTVLIKEIHHRVKNNLQIIVSLLRLQMTDVKNAEAKSHFSEAINRVLVMSSIHQKLYREEDITKFSLSSYIEELSTELKQFFKEEFPIEIKIDSDYDKIDLKTVVPVGLILNELFSNTFKYAFEGRESGEINVVIRDLDDKFKLTYTDNGRWKTPDNENTGFGVELIQILTEQLNGKVEFTESEEGTTYEFELMKMKENKHEK